MESLDYFTTESFFMFDLFSIIIPIIFVFVIGSLIVTSIKGVSEWSSNNNQPILDIHCKVISKRMDVSRHTGHHDANGHYVGGGSCTFYYVTFEFESKDRVEFRVNGYQYGMLIEGDYGKLKFRGTRFLDFNRQDYTSQ